MSATKPTDSERAREATEPAAPAPPKPRGPARRLDDVTALLLLGAVITALGAAGPAVLRAAGAPLPAAEPTAPVPPLDLRHQPPELLANPDPALDPERDLDRSSDPDDAPAAGVAPLPTGHVRPGLARSALSLRERPNDAGRPVGHVKAGELVMIVRESGEWVQIWASGPEGVVMGWARKSGIAVR